MRIKKDESYEKLVFAKIGVSVGVSETEIAGLDVWQNQISKLR